ncbi:type II toxin-antitoxin system RelE/ParE family toxin [Ensifer sp. 2YAB10]|uniref:type II toxin-antitoxin system RelE/ParE family toxin n=1 Tax=unclassified Ensifer TaxID=2633371 RepID=UPI003F900307
MLPSALTDLVNIFEYITRQSGSLVVGRRFVGELRQKCRSLADLPGTLGRARPELRPEIRSAVFKGYVIFFRYVDERGRQYHRGASRYRRVVFLGRR